MKDHRFSFSKHVTGQQKNDINALLDQAVAWCTEHPKTNLVLPVNPRKTKMTKCEYICLHCKNYKAKQKFKGHVLSWKTEVEGKIRREARKEFDSKLRDVNKKGRLSFAIICDNC